MKRGSGKHMFGLSLFRPSRQSNISTSGEERFKYPLPWENKISQMPYPRVNKDNQIPTPCPASPPPHAGMTLIGALEDTNERIKNIDISLLNVVIFVDLKKAFHTMDHVILLQKLEFYGVRSQTLAWFKSYFTGRKKKT